MRLFSFFYNLALGLYSLTYLPKLFSKKYALRRNFKMPEIVKTDRPMIWIHAVSVGETRAVVKLAQMLKEQLNGTLIFSNITTTGHQEALKSIPFADYHILLPLDFSWTMEALISKAKPDLVIITETDFWIHFLNQCEQKGAFIALVNGKISERSFKRLQYFPWLARKLYSPVSLFCVQSDVYGKKFHELGVPMDKIYTVPNLKYDDFPDVIDRGALRARLGIEEGDFVVVAGSTHPGEELIILEAFEKANIPSSKLLIVPRHPERFNEVGEVLKGRGLLFSRYTMRDTPHKVTLIDAMGLLRQCYAIASIAVVGGSFVPGVGGHNILEPVFLSVPVLFGPYMEGQIEMVEITLKYEVGKPTNAKNLCDDFGFSADKDKFIQALEGIQGGVIETFNLIMHKYACDKRHGIL